MSAPSLSVQIAAPSTGHHLVRLTVRFVATAVAAAILWTAGGSATDASASADAHHAAAPLVTHGS